MKESERTALPFILGRVLGEGSYGRVYADAKNEIKAYKVRHKGALLPDHDGLEAEHAMHGRAWRAWTRAAIEGAAASFRVPEPDHFMLLRQGSLIRDNTAADSCAYRMDRVPPPDMATFCAHLLPGCRFWDKDPHPPKLYLGFVSDVPLVGDAVCSNHLAGSSVLRSAPGTPRTLGAVTHGEVGLALARSVGEVIALFHDSDLVAKDVEILATARTGGPLEVWVVDFNLVHVGRDTASHVTAYVEDCGLGSHTPHWGFFPTRFSAPNAWDAMCAAYSITRRGTEGPVPSDFVAAVDARVTTIGAKLARRALGTFMSGDTQVEQNPRLAHIVAWARSVAATSDEELESMARDEDAADAIADLVDRTLSDGLDGVDMSLF